jgi:hypothetical protein
VGERSAANFLLAPTVTPGMTSCDNVGDDLFDDLSEKSGLKLFRSRTLNDELVVSIEARSPFCDDSKLSMSERDSPIPKESACSDCPCTPPSFSTCPSDSFCGSILAVDDDKL